MYQIFKVIKTSTLFDSHSPYSRNHEELATFIKVETAEFYKIELVETESKDNDYEYNIEYNVHYEFVYDSINEMELHQQELENERITRSSRPKKQN